MTPTSSNAPSADTAAAFRRAAVQHHHRTVTAELESSPDRTALLAELTAPLAGRPASVLVVRPDVPDRSGSGIAPALLDQVADRIRSVVREPHGVHRVGDRCVVVLPGDRYVADWVARRVVAACASPFSLGPTDHRLTVAVGVAGVLDAESPVEAFHRAELAAVRAASTPERVSHAGPDRPGRRDPR